jgi:hypothetical protein
MLFQDNYATALIIICYCVDFNMFHLNKYDASCFSHKKIGASDFYHASTQFVSTYLYVISHFNMLLIVFLQQFTTK